MKRLVERMRTLEHRVHDAGAARREEFAGGVAYFHDALPAVWDVNFLRLDRPCEAPAAEADRLQAGIGHRKVLIEDPALLERFGPELRARGFGERALVAMAREPGGELDPGVREVPYEDVVPLRQEVLAEQLNPPDPAVIEQVVEANRLESRSVGIWLAIADEGRLAGHCIVYSHGGLAQIENVATLRAHRRRGLSRRLLRHALELAAADHDTVFLTAEADGFPAAFYRRLGFGEVERRGDFLLIVAAP